MSTESELCAWYPQLDKPVCAPAAALVNDLIAVNAGGRRFALKHELLGSAAAQIHQAADTYEPAWPARVTGIMHGLYDYCGCEHPDATQGY